MSSHNNSLKSSVHSNPTKAIGGSRSRTKITRSLISPKSTLPPVKEGIVCPVGYVCSLADSSVQDAACSISTYIRNINANPSPISTASAFFINFNESPYLITTAHSILPQPDKLFNGCYPFVVYNENFQYGITSLNEWPFDYSVSATIKDSNGNKTRKFIEVGLFGVDWDSDLAVFVLGEDITIDTVKCIDLNDSLPSVSVGDKVESFSDAYSMQSDIYVSGSVRLANYQYDPLRAPCHFTDLSFAAGSSGSLIVLSGTNQLVGMHRASGNYGNVPPFVFSQETSASVLFDVMTRIYEAVTDADANTLDESNLMVVVATQSQSLGLIGKALNLEDLSRDIRIEEAEGYLYKDSLPYYALEGFVNESDIVTKIANEGEDFENVLPLGTFEPYQETLYEAYKRMGATGAQWDQEKEIALGTAVDVETRRYFSGGWEIKKTVYRNLLLDLYVGKWWSWWFMWGLNSASPSVKEIEMINMDATVSSLFTRKNPSPNPGYFLPLKTTDTRSSNNPYDQQLFISSIGTECKRYMEAFCLNSNKNMVPQLYSGYGMNVLTGGSSDRLAALQAWLNRR